MKFIIDAFEDNVFEYPYRFGVRTDYELSDTDQDEEISNLESESYDE